MAEPERRCWCVRCQGRSIPLERARRHSRAYQQLSAEEVLAITQRELQVGTQAMAYAGSRLIAEDCKPHSLPCWRAQECVELQEGEEGDSGGESGGSSDEEGGGDWGGSRLAQQIAEELAAECAEEEEEDVVDLWAGQ